MFLLPTRQRYPRGGRTVNLSGRGPKGPYGLLLPSRPITDSSRSPVSIVREEKKRRGVERKKSIAIRFTPRCIEKRSRFDGRSKLDFFHTEREREGRILLLRIVTNIALRKMRYIKKERFLADESFDAINATPVENADLRGAAASAGRAIIRRERRIETTRLEVLFNQSVSKY